MEPHYNAYATNILQRYHDRKGNGYPTVEVYTSHVSTEVTNLVFSRVCKVTNEVYQVTADVIKVYEWLHNRELIQNALPELPTEQRDFLLMNLTPAEMEMMLPDTEEELEEAIEQAFDEVMKKKDPSDIELNYEDMNLRVGDQISDYNKDLPNSKLFIVNRVDRNIFHNQIKTLVLAAQSTASALKICADNESIGHIAEEWEDACIRYIGTYHNSEEEIILTVRERG